MTRSRMSSAVTMAASPKRTEAGIRRGLRHNMVRLGDGRWRWRYDLGRNADDGVATERVSTAAGPTSRRCGTTCRGSAFRRCSCVGGDSVFVLPEDVDEFRRAFRRPGSKSLPAPGMRCRATNPQRSSRCCRTSSTQDDGSLGRRSAGDIDEELFVTGRRPAVVAADDLDVDESRTFEQRLDVGA